MNNLRDALIVLATIFIIVACAAHVEGLYELKCTPKPQPMTDSEVEGIDTPQGPTSHRAPGLMT